MQAQLRDVLNDLERALERVRLLASAYTNEEWLARPSEGSWSAAECIAHLNLTSEAYVPLLEEGLAEARALGGNPPERFRKDLLGWLIWRTVRPEARMRVKTTPSFVPGGATDKGALVADFERLQDAQMNAARAAEGLPIHRVKIASPFAERVHYSLYSGLAILAAHQHRHLGQAERAVIQVVAGSGR